MITLKDSGAQKAFMLLFTCMMMASCVNQGPTYQEPKPDPGRTVTLDESKRTDGFMNFTFFGVGKVNGVPLKVKTRFSKGGLSHTVAAGPQKLTLVMVHTSPLYKYGQMNAEGEVKAVLKPGLNYEAYGVVRGSNKADLWLQERASKQRVSEVISVVPVKVAPAPVPVFIPAS